MIRPEPDQTTPLLIEAMIFLGVSFCMVAVLLELAK